MITPSLEAFLPLSQKGNLVPVTLKLLADEETPLSAYRKLRGQGESFLFESVEGGEHLGRYSFLGCQPKAIIRQWNSTVEVLRHGQPRQEYTITPNPEPGSGQVRDGLQVIEEILKPYQPVEIEGLPRFTGGAVGFIGYEFIHDIEPKVPKPEKNELGTPTLYFMVADEILVFDRVTQTITLIVNAFIHAGESAEQTYHKAVTRIHTLVKLLNQPSHHPCTPIPSTQIPSSWKSNMVPEHFHQNVLKAKEYIHAGDIIQVVGSQRFSMPNRVDVIDIYRAARMINPSPYMFLLELEGFSLVGASPEIHVRCEDGVVEIRPIAGTRPRGQTPEQDQAHETELLADPKERAEHVMLVDLARNDIGRVCSFGSVQVKDLMLVERYSHVMHIVSQVEGHLAPGRSPYDLIRATFPAGTLSGAPKIRAMQIISELEQTQRGPYGGCVGYFSFNGNLDCCITIRTALVQPEQIHIQAGGGWVSDSVPQTEFEETVNKAKAMLRAVAMAESFSPPPFEDTDSLTPS